MTNKEIGPGDATGAEEQNHQRDAGRNAALIVDRSPLRQALDTAIAEAANNGGGKLSMKDLTVMSEQSDPFRLDTPANHDLGRWLADTAATLGLGARKIHNRGLHYMILGQPKPDGSTYVSDDDNWTFLEKASKFARWLGHIPFDQIVDQRNAAPVVRIHEPREPWPYLGTGVHVEIPVASDLHPQVDVEDFKGVQPYKLVLVGEKSSLDAVLAPVAERYAADLYLPTGDISDTMVHQMAKIGAADGRPLVVIYFADADPSGWNMGIVVARKLQAFKVLHFPDLEFEVHRAGLTPDQVREFELPSTPLKESERRADKWRAAMGVEQTEIDALATLRPDLLRQVAQQAIKPFYDTSLERRVREAKQAWIERAQAVVDSTIDQDHLDRMQAEFAAKMAELRAEVDAINDALRIDTDQFELPPIVVPEAEVTQGLAPLPLLDSSWSFVEQTKALIDSKAYRNGGGPE